MTKYNNSISVENFKNISTCGYELLCIILNQIDFENSLYAVLQKKRKSNKLN